MPLYRVTVSRKFYVVADAPLGRGDEYTAASYAEDDGGPWDVSSVEVESLSRVPQDMRDTLPHGDNADDITIEKFFARRAEGV